MSESQICGQGIWLYNGPRRRLSIRTILAPECYGNQDSQWSDVFSFGLIVL
jgi:hypothetical protein